MMSFFDASNISRRAFHPSIHPVSMKDSCPCHRPAVLCGHCVKQRLQIPSDLRQRHQAAKEQALEYFTQRSSTPDWTELLQQAQDARSRLQQLRQQANQLALQVATTAVQHEEKQQLHSLDDERQALDDWKSLQTTALDHALDQQQKRVKRLRQLWALQALQLHHLDVSSKLAKIDGLPLPHSPDWYAMVPASLDSALALVARLTQRVAQCLHIHLPYPLQPSPPDLLHAPPGTPGTALVESPTQSYSLHQQQLSQPEALPLLQHNVLYLCIHAGVQELWPGEALLGNLQALQQHLQQQVEED